MIVLKAGDIGIDLMLWSLKKTTEFQMCFPEVSV
jgi:hypothetical protein